MSDCLLCSFLMLLLLLLFLQREFITSTKKIRRLCVRLDFTLQFSQRGRARVCLQNWERCEKGIDASLEKLRVFKTKLAPALPDHHEELHSEQMRCKVRRGVFCLLLHKQDPPLSFTNTHRHTHTHTCPSCIPFNLAARINRQTGGS